MAYTTIDDPTQFFTCFLWTGDGTSPKSFTGVGFQADMMWSKIRTDNHQHNLVDTVRGVNQKLLMPSDNGDEDTTCTHGHFDSLDSDGFTITGAGGYWNVNTNAENYVGWLWKASGTSISNSSGSNGATLASAGIKNDTAGISIVTYTGDGNARTVFHGLSSCDMVIHKCLNNNENWGVQHKDIGAAYQLQLDTTIAKVDKSGNGSMALPAANVFSVNNSGQWGAARNYVAYAFRSVKGYSKFGNYTGNGNSNGAFIYTGFRPAWVMAKNTGDTKSWFMYDNKRDPFNPTTQKLRADTTAAEATGTDKLIDMYSNGFKIRTDDAEFNGSGNEYIYMAFAENPFVTSTGIPTTAR